MKIAYFDCFCGAGGDMILGALVDAGLSETALREELSLLGLDGYTLEIRRIRKQGIAATKVDVVCARQQAHRHLKHIVEILDRSRLALVVRDQARQIFSRLAEAEAAVHGTSVEKVHFHEVGAIDAIVDVVGTVAGLHRLGVGKVECSPIPTGSGTVTCDHGIMPVPAPATALLLRGVPLADCDEVGELTTPTAAAILTTLATRFGPLPAMSLLSAGFGAGTREAKSRPNLLRVLIGEAGPESAQVDEVVEIEANLDDVTGELLGYVSDRLMQAGALDVATTPITMKKSRPGVRLSVLARPMDADRLCDIIFLETTTFGVRQHTCRRQTLVREVESVETTYGPIRVKVGRRDGRVIVASPEYEDCAAAARERGVAWREVMDAARLAWSMRGGGGRTADRPGG